MPTDSPEEASRRRKLTRARKKPWTKPSATPTPSSQWSAGRSSFSTSPRGQRNQATTDIFIEGLRAATSPQEFQITTDGFTPYRSAIDNTLSDPVNFAQLIKLFQANPEGEHRYSPADVVAVEVVPVLGNPDPDRICTSHVERQNLTMRMQIRRLTRLTNAFSKKWENLWAALCLHFAYYNFCRIHKTLRVTPAMEAGITDRVWTIREPLAARG